MRDRLVRLNRRLNEVAWQFDLPSQNVLKMQAPMLFLFVPSDFSLSKVFAKIKKN